MNAARSTAALLRRDLEERLAARIPQALTPAFRPGLERNRCGVAEIDRALGGGLPVGAITELVGAECSGRTTMALACVAAGVRAGNVAAWIDVEDTFDPASAALCGVEGERLLWVRCRTAEAAAADRGAGGQPAATVTPLGVPVPPGGCGGLHPRSETRGMDRAIQDLMVTQPRSTALARPGRNRAIGTPSAPNRQLPGRSVDREEQVPTDRQPSRRALQQIQQAAPRVDPPAGQGKVWQMQIPSSPVSRSRRAPKHDWSALDKALKATDLILQSGGFSMLVLDLGSTSAEMSWRVPLASWFRFRAACQRTQSSLLLLTRHPCARSSAELTVRLQPGQMQAEGGVFTALNFRAEVERARFANAPQNKVVPLRKPPQRVEPGVWKGRATWAI